MKEVAKELGISHDAVVYFMRKHNLRRRDASKSNSVRFEHQIPSFNRRVNLNHFQKELQAIGTALYWAEGYKSEKSVAIDFANSDPQMVKLFLSFLRTSFILTEKKFRVLLYCHSNQNVTTLIKFWSKLTAIPQTQFSKPYTRLPGARRETSSRRMLHGLVHIRYHDKKLLLAVKDLIRYYHNKFAQVDP